MLRKISLTILLVIYWPLANANLLGNGTITAGFGVNALPYYWGIPANVFTGVSYVGSTEGVLLTAELFSIGSPDSATTFDVGSTFDILVRLLTNGVNDQLGWTISGSMGGVSTGMSEAAYFAGSPGVVNGIDFSRSTIDRIDFSVINRIASPGNDLNHDGIWTDWKFDLSMSVYGTSAVPEPSNILLVLAALAALTFTRQRSSIEKISPL